MKIIDILHNIANKGTVPDKIKVFDEEFIYDKELKDYQDEDGDWLFQDYDWLNELNTEVNILEICITYNQNKKIEKLDLDDYTLSPTGAGKIEFTITEKILGKKINEIIDFISKEEE